MFLANDVFAKKCDPYEYLLTGSCYDCPAGCYCTNQGSGNWSALDPDGNGKTDIENKDVTKWCAGTEGFVCAWNDIDGDPKHQAGVTVTPAECGSSNSAGVFRCPDGYTSDAGGALVDTDCWLSLSEGFYIPTPKSQPKPCPAERYCPAEQQVYYGQTTTPQKLFYGTITLNMDVDGSCCTIDKSILYAKAETEGENSGKYVLYTDSGLKTQLKPNNRAIPIDCSACTDSAFIGMYDVNNKQRMKKVTQDHNSSYLILAATNAYELSTLFPTGSESAAWTAKYDKAYTVTLSGNGGAGGTTEFKVFGGKAYQASGFNINSDNNTPLDHITRPSSNLGYIFNGYYYNGEQLIDAEGYPTSIFNDVVRNISRNQTWNASWEIVHTIYLNPNNGGTSVSKYSVLGGKLYEFGNLSKEINIVTDVQASQDDSIGCYPKLSAGELPTFSGRGFAGYYRSDDQMINSEGCPTVNFVGEVQGMDNSKTWNAKWVKYYNVTLKNGCSESDKGCVTQFEVHENAVPFKTKEIMEDGKEDEVDPPVKITKIDIIPTKTNYTFEGYYYSGEQMIDRNGNFTSLGTAEMMDMTSTKAWTASWAYCNPSTGGVQGNTCNMPGKGEYLDNGSRKTCPGYKNGAFSVNELYPSVSVEKEWFEFTTYSQAGLGKGRCAIRYNPEIDPENKGLCGNGTKVIYAWNESDGNYKLIDDHYVLAGNLAGNSNNDLEIDFTDENISKIERDYCGACGKNGADDQYNVGGMGCGYCNNGYCVDKHNTCIKCPAGYACPGPEQGETGNLECDHRENQYSIPTLYCRGDQYSMEGATVCSDCAEGYSTMNSSTSLCAIQIAGSGVGCTSVRACVPVPPYLVKKDLTNIGDNPQCGPSYSILSRRSSCNRSFGLGNGVKMLKKYTGFAREYLPPDYTPVPSDSDD